jgi:hypothetical protein
MRGWVCLMNKLAFCQVHISHIHHVTKNSSFCTTHESSVSTDFTEQIMPVLRILCYNGSLVIWTAVSLTTSKFKPLILKVKVKGTLRLTVSLGVEPHVGLMTRYLLLFDSYGLVFVGAPSLTRGRVCLSYMLLALASPLGLATIFYCLRFETYLFVTPYDSQGHGIRRRLHMGYSPHGLMLLVLFSLYSLRTDHPQKISSKSQWDE